MHSGKLPTRTKTREFAPKEALKEVIGLPEHPNRQKTFGGSLRLYLRKNLFSLVPVF